MSSAQTEPSMDDILASIRRIIADDEETQETTQVKNSLDSVEEETADTDTEASAEAHQEEVTEELAEEAAGSVDEVVAEETVATSDDIAAEETSEEIEVNANTSTVNEAFDKIKATFETLEEDDDEDGFDISVEENAVTEETETASLDEPAPEKEVPSFTSRFEPKTETVIEPAHSLAEVKEEITQTVSREVEDNMVSKATAGVAASAFETLEENVRVANGEGKTLESIVEQMLQPLLTQWLDENLPRIVEEKVEEEVRRIARRR